MPAPSAGRPLQAPSSRGEPAMLAIIGNVIVGFVAVGLFSATVRLSK
jgi:hypothetical protein